MLQEILKSQAHFLVGSILLWTAIGAVAGLALGILIYFACARAGAFALDWRHAKWLRAASAVFLTGALALLAASMGGCEGTLRGVERVVDKSQFRTEGLDRVAALGAAGTLWLDLHLLNLEAGKPGALTPEQVKTFEAYERGEHELDVPAFAGRLGRAEDRIVREAAPQCREYLRAKVGIPDSAVVDTMLTTALEVLLKRKLRAEVRERFEAYGVDVERFYASLAGLARARGHPDRVSFRELADHIAAEVLVPAVLTPARGLVRGQQFTCALLMAGAVALPLAGFWIARRLMRPSPQPDPGAAPTA